VGKLPIANVELRAWNCS